jgi:hypothetical protein
MIVLLRGGACLVAASVALVVLAIVGAGGPAAAPHSSASSVNVFLGYADSLRANPTRFPTPWAGSPGVTFDGCPAQNCSFDAGAVRFVNNTEKTTTIEAVTVKVSTCAFKLWKSHNLAPGEQLIVTQTASAATPGCVTDGSMDASDVGPGGEDYTGNCTPDGVKPTVEASINGTLSTFTDEGQILNTGGFDLATCPSGTNESANWVSVGSRPCGKSQLTLAPGSQSQPVGGKATVTATFACENGEPLAGAVVKFDVLSGPNAGGSGTETTNANGEASYPYSSAKAGADQLQASVTTPVGTITSNTTQVNWVAPFAPGGGAFVIGDLNSTVGSKVTFWGARWWKLNFLSLGPAPASFKGFASRPATPTCGTTWSAEPGNSAPPPAGPLPEFMSVLVASSISKSGSRISGDTVQIVVVKTNPGYARNPGHAGTGTVVSKLCEGTGTPGGHHHHGPKPRRARDRSGPHARRELGRAAHYDLFLRTVGARQSRARVP